MGDLLLFAAAGFAATFVDGALGMGFGPTSSSILLGTGLAPAAVSTFVNIAKLVTGIASALAHWRLRNVERRLVLALAVPGSIGAVLGVTVLSRIDGRTIRPYLAVLLTLVGVRMLHRFMGAPTPAAGEELREPLHGAAQHHTGGVAIAGLLGGVTNGLVGAWGPVVTPYLMNRAVHPRFAIGSVNTAEVAVASASAFTLIGSLGVGGVDGRALVAMLAGGVVAAPLAAWVIRYVPARPMGVAVAVLLLMTNASQVLSWAGFTYGPLTGGLYAAAIALVMFTASRSRAGARLHALAPLGDSALDTSVARPSPSSLAPRP
jgi:uncharacterized membrane protein YfcA